MARFMARLFDSTGCQLSLPEDAAELRGGGARDILEPVGPQPGEMCCICLDESPDAKLPCGHAFHASCLESWFEQRPICPTCRQAHGEHRGSMPDGSMSWSWSRATLAGQPAECGTIVLHFNFPSGTGSQGQVYDGRSQHAYLPDNDEGRQLLAMFQLAFRRRVLFSLDRSLTTGRWQPTFAIHLKTSMTGGPARHGYPDDQYFASATRELRDKGIELQAALPVAIELRPSSSLRLQFFRRTGRFCSVCRRSLVVQ